MTQLYEHGDVHIMLSVFLCDLVNVILRSGERGGSVVECRTPEREFGGLKSTAAMLCP